MLHPSATREFLLAHYAAHPASCLQDLRKALYQSTFGCEHLSADPSAAAERIRAEAEDIAVRERTIEALDGPWARVSLGFLDDGLTAETFAAAFARSAAIPGENTAALEQRLTTLLELVQTQRIPLPYSEATAEIAAWRADGFPPCHHSDAYRSAYRPSYRVLHRSYVRLLPLLTAIDRQLAKKPRVLLAIEGGAASGKSSMAEMLQALYGAAVFHADDFFLRPEQRTEARYASPGGNLDRERLEAEVLIPVSRGAAGEYRPFDCRTMVLGAPRPLEPGRLNIVEGCYSLHPALEGYYDLSVFLDISPQTQRRRVLARNGAEMGQRFFDRWIPLENAYFQAARTAERCTLRLKEDT